MKITWNTIRVKVDLIDPSPTNYKIANELGKERLKQSLKEFGLAGSVICNKVKGRYVLIDGNSRLLEAKEAREKYLNVSIPNRPLTQKEFVKMCKVYDLAKAGDQDENRIAAETDDKHFYKQYNLPVPARLLDTLGSNSKVVLDKRGDKDKELREAGLGKLREKYVEPPFSVLDTKQGSWQERKRDWIEWGVVGELGREGDLVFNLGDLSKVKSRDGVKVTPKKLTQGIPMKKYSNMDEYYSKEAQAQNTSVFDPVLCELMYSWFCPKGGKILDPFAGGPSRGLVAQYLGYKYTGIDLSRRQINANVASAKELLKSNNQPTYYCGDSNELLGKKWKDRFDFVFSCPPYFNLEVYSKDEKDLSNMSYEDFQGNYSVIVERACDLLKPNRYACFVISPVRDKKGNYLDLVGDTIRAFKDAGLEFYNDAVLLNMIGSASMRADKQFSAGKKLVRVHQNVLIFYKP